MKSRKETRALHERTAEDKFTAYELTDSEDFDKRQMARNILRYQLRQYCFELPPTCSRWGRGCFSCSHLKCRENELYDGEKWSYDFDPDIDRFASLWENLSGMATVSYKGLLDGTADVAAIPQAIDTECSMSSLLSALCKQGENGDVRTTYPKQSR